MPYFVDPGEDVLLKNFTDEPDKYTPISSTDYLQHRIMMNYSRRKWEQQIN